MAESVQVANDAVAHALATVTKWDDKIEEEESKEEINVQRLEFYVQERDKATLSRDKEREYYLRLTQPNIVPTETGDPFFSQIEPVVEKNDMLTFPAPIPLTKRCQLYVRSAYKVIYDAATMKKDESKRKYAVVTGTPGIGKSSFLYYVFWKMVKAKKRVFFITQSVYFDGARMWEYASMPPRTDRQFWTMDLWCLIDSADPTTMPGLPYDNCSILLATTSRNDYHSQFRKLVPIPPVFYMPLWSRDELQSISSLYPDSSAWENRFIVLGGVPRYVLEDVSRHPESLLRSACRECSLDDAIHVVSIDSEITTKTKVVQKLIHLHSQTPYNEAEVRYASPVAVKIIAHTHWRRCHQEMQTLLWSADVNPLAAALCGYIFETHAKKLLEKGGEFDCRELVAGRARKKAKVKIIVPSSPEPAIFSERVSTDQKNHQLYVPKTSNFASIDAWMHSFGAFQMTVGKTHDIKDGATADIANLGNGGYRLFWLLPPLYFDSFTKKKPQKFDFEQFAILIPYPEAVGQSWDDSKMEDEDANIRYGR